MRSWMLPALHIGRCGTRLEGLGGTVVLTDRWPVVPRTPGGRGAVGADRARSDDGRTTASADRIVAADRLDRQMHVRVHRGD